MEPIKINGPTFCNLNKISEYHLMPNLMQIIFDPSKHSPPNDFINNLKKRLDQYHKNDNYNKHFSK
tara:strand:+ start:3811 stop:4008 length:198 start_codon:yes stop_codon:yes gene_type:complete